MTTTSLLAFVVARRIWRWSTMHSPLVVVPLVAIDVTFFAANAGKIGSGGWFPLLFGSVVFVVMRTWHRGRTRMPDVLRMTASR